MWGLLFFLLCRTSRGDAQTGQGNLAFVFAVISSHCPTDCFYSPLAPFFASSAICTSLLLQGTFRNAASMAIATLAPALFLQRPDRLPHALQPSELSKVGVSSSFLCVLS